MPHRRVSSEGLTDSRAAVASGDDPEYSTTPCVVVNTLRSSEHHSTVWCHNTGRVSHNSCRPLFNGSIRYGTASVQDPTTYGLKCSAYNILPRCPSVLSISTLRDPLHPQPPRVELVGRTLPTNHQLPLRYQTTCPYLYLGISKLPTTAMVTTHSRPQHGQQSSHQQKKDEQRHFSSQKSHSSAKMFTRQRAECIGVASIRKRMLAATYRGVQSPAAQLGLKTGQRKWHVMDSHIFCLQRSWQHGVPHAWPEGTWMPIRSTPQPQVMPPSAPVSQLQRHLEQLVEVRQAAQALARENKADRTVQ
jgi:hypothetical protein